MGIEQVLKNIHEEILRLVDRIDSLEEKVEKLELWKINNLNSEQLKDLKGKLNVLWERDPLTKRDVFEHQNRIEALKALFGEFSGKGEYLEVKKILQEERKAKSDE